MSGRVLVPVLIILVVAGAQPASAGPAEQQILFSTRHTLAIPRTYTLRFSLWTDPDDTDEGLSMAWSEQTSMKLTTNRIKHYLGGVDPVGNPLELADFSQQLWVQVDRWKKKSSSWARVTAVRSKLKMLPYAMNSHGVADGSVNSLSIQDGTVAADDLQDGAAIAEIADDDGAGSGLDADVLDGQQGSFYRAWGNLTSVPPGFADGVDNTGGDFANVVNVAASGADYTSIQTAVDGITDAAADNLYLVRVAPGVYTESVTLKPHVHLQGAGQDVTILTNSVANASWPPTTATLVLDDHVSVRDLTVDNNAASGDGVAVLALDGCVPVLVSEVTAVARDGEDNYAFFVTGASTEVVLSNVTALGQNGANYNYGLYNWSGPQTVLRGGSFTAEGGTTTYAILSFSSGTTLSARGISATGRSGSSSNFGMRNSTGGTAILLGGSFTGEGGVTGYGLSNYGSGSTLEAHGISASGSSGTGGNYGLHNYNGAAAVLQGGSFGASGGTQPCGIYNYGSGTSLEAHAVSASGENGSNENRGLFNRDGASAVLSGGSFTGDGGEDTYGIHNIETGTTLDATGVSAVGKNGTNANAGLFNYYQCSAVLRGGSFVGDGGTAAYGLRNSWTDTTIDARNISAVGKNASSASYGLHNASSITTLAQSVLEGGNYSTYLSSGTVMLSNSNLVTGDGHRSSGILTCVYVSKDGSAYTCP